MHNSNKESLEVIRPAARTFWAVLPWRMPFVALFFKANLDNFMFNKFLDEDDVYKLKEDAAEDADGVNGGVIERELELLLLPLALPLAPALARESPPWEPTC